MPWQEYNIHDVFYTPAFDHNDKTHLTTPSQMNTDCIVYPTPLRPVIICPKYMHFSISSSIVMCWCKPHNNAINLLIFIVCSGFFWYLLLLFKRIVGSRDLYIPDLHVIEVIESERLKEKDGVLYSPIYSQFKKFNIEADNRTQYFAADQTFFNNSHAV